MKPATWLPMVLALLIPPSAVPSFDPPPRAPFAPRLRAQGKQDRQELPIVLKASVALDGRGQILRDTTIVVQGSKIVGIG
jgi:hypothetical protein